jgi:hypothetical protein
MITAKEVAGRELPSLYYNTKEKAQREQYWKQSLFSNTPNRDATGN